jgi:hypothetical protein
MPVPRPVIDAEFQQRCVLLTEQLGSDPTAVRAAHAVVRYMDIDTPSALRAYYEKVGPVVFAYEVADLRGVGVASAERITQLVASLEPVT